MKIKRKKQKKITFEDFVIQCASNDQLVKEFNRLTGCNLGQSMRRTNLEILIDEATGYSGESERDMLKFCVFVAEYIWDRVVL